MRHLFRTILCLALFFATTMVRANEYSLSIHPILPPDKIEKSFGPLANYLSEKTGHTIKLQTFSGFKAYWYKMKRLKGFDMVIDGAHFVDYRIKNNGYRVLAKIPETVSYTVVSREDLFVFEVDELADYKVATMDAPAAGGLRLMEAFLESEKSPMTIGSYDADDCIKHIQDGRADAAVIPTPMVGRYSNLNVVTTTDPMPHTAFSVSADIPSDVAEAIKIALLEADSTEEGRQMLKAAGLPLFVDTDAATYDGQAKLLDVMMRRSKAM